MSAEQPWDLYDDEQEVEAQHIPSGSVEWPNAMAACGADVDEHFVGLTAEAEEDEHGVWWCSGCLSMAARPWLRNERGEVI